MEWLFCVKGCGDGGGGHVGGELVVGLEDAGFRQAGLGDDFGIHFHGEVIDVDMDETVGVGEEVEAGEVAILGGLEGERAAVDGAANGGLWGIHAAGEQGSQNEALGEKHRETVGNRWKHVPSAIHPTEVGC